MLDALRHHDDPGISARLLAVSNAIDLPLRRPRAWPRCLLARTCVAEAAVLALVTAAIVGLLVATP